MKKIIYVAIFTAIFCSGLILAKEAKAFTATPEGTIKDSSVSCSGDLGGICVNYLEDQNTGLSTVPCPKDMPTVVAGTACKLQNAGCCVKSCSTDGGVCQGWTDLIVKSYICTSPAGYTIYCTPIYPPADQPTPPDCVVSTGGACTPEECNLALSAGTCIPIYNLENSQFTTASQSYDYLRDCYVVDSQVNQLKACVKPIGSSGTGTSLPGSSQCTDFAGAHCSKTCTSQETAYTSNSSGGDIGCTDSLPKCCITTSATCKPTGQCKSDCATGESSLGSDFIDCYSTASSSIQKCCVNPQAATKPAGSTTTPRIPQAPSGTGGLTIDINPIKGVGDIKAAVFIGRIIQTILSIIGAIALLMVIYGGIILLTSKGGEGVKKGKDILTWSIIGIGVILGSYALVSFILTAIGTGTNTSTTGTSATTTTTTAPSTPSGTSTDIWLVNRPGDCVGQGGVCLNVNPVDNSWCTPAANTTAPSQSELGLCAQATAYNLHYNYDTRTIGCGTNQVCFWMPAPPTTTTTLTKDSNGCYLPNNAGNCTPGTSANFCCDCGIAPGTENRTCKAGKAASAQNSTGHCGKEDVWCLP
ncbi:MAG: pilin [Patescibacteria group bacterium]